jgi:drug/metabolite transporter (DMT)-like permease
VQRPGGRPLDPFAVSLMTFLCLLWGSNQVVLKLTAPEMGMVFQLGFRSLAAAVLVVAWMALRRQPAYWRDGTLAAGALAGTLFAAEFLVIGYGLALTTASHMSVFLYTAPIFTALGLHLLDPAERLSLRQWTGIAIAFAGVFVVFALGFLAPPDDWSAMLAGDALAVLAGLLWSATTVTVRVTRLREAPAAKTLFYQLALGGVILTAAAALQPGGLGLPVSAWGWTSIAYQSVIVAFASFFAWFWLLTRYSTSRLSAFSFLMPVSGVAFGVVVLDEPLTLNLIAGGALILAGIALVNGPPRRVPQPRAS